MSMFNWLKKKPPTKEEQSTEVVVTEENQTQQEETQRPLEVENIPASVIEQPPVTENVPQIEFPPEPVIPQPEQEKKSLWSSLRHGLKRTRTQWASGLATLVLGRKKIDAELLTQIEAQLLTADVGIATTQRLIQEMTDRVKRSELSDPNALLTAIQQSLCEGLKHCQVPWVIPSDKKPYVILMVGVNGTGKTTTIGKLARRLQKEGKSVCLAAGDTFRAAAVEQLKIWGERNKIQVIAQQTGADSASVIFDALSSARNKGIDVLIADTAGRLHTQSHLMDELKKIKRVMSKLDDTAPHEIMLVLDAGIGQNALRQAEQFHAALGLTSLTVTKLDGTAKGGTVFALAESLKLPIRFIGVGEGIEDLQPFNAESFVQALFSEEAG